MNHNGAWRQNNIYLYKNEAIWTVSSGGFIFTITENT